MHRSRFSSLFAIVAIAASAFACAFERVRERVVNGFRDVWRFLTSAAPAPIVGDRLDMDASRELSAASAFVKRLIKRERPRIEARWAMCPSI